MDVSNIERRPQGESTYVSSLTAATIPPPASSAAPARSSQLQKNQNSAEQERDRQADEFSKSVTIIFWYKAKAEPIRLQQMIPTFPYFQLSRLGSLISDLGLSSNSYLDTFNPISSQWEQHTISSVRVVESQQRLLYRIRKSLFEGLTEDDCVGLRDEVHLQHSGTTQSYALSAHVKLHPGPVNTSGQGRDSSSTTQSLKRYAPDVLESSQPTKIHVPNNYYTTQIDTSGGKQSQSSSSSSQQQQQQQQQQATGPVSLPTPPTTAEVLPSSSSSEESNYIYRPQQQQQQQHQNYYASPAATPGTTIPSPYTATSKDHPPQPTPVHYPPHPPLKRWPNDYTVFELTMGFNEMDALIAQSPASDNMTQRVAFERIFGLRYVKSTVCRHRAIWKKADRNLRQQFEALGTDQRACWGEFVRRVEGRPSGKPGAGGGGVGGGVTSASTSKLVYNGTRALTVDFYHQNANGSGADDHQNEPVMDSLQIPGNQGSSVTVGSSLQGSGAMSSQNINVYDPNLAQHMPSGSHP